MSILLLSEFVGYIETLAVFIIATRLHSEFGFLFGQEHVFYTFRYGLAMYKSHMKRTSKLL